MYICGDLTQTESKRSQQGNYLGETKDLGASFRTRVSRRKWTKHGRVRSTQLSDKANASILCGFVVENDVEQLFIAARARDDLELCRRFVLLGIGARIEIKREIGGVVVFVRFVCGW